MQSWQEHAHFRKLIAGPVRIIQASRHYRPRYSLRKDNRRWTLESETNDTDSGLVQLHQRQEDGAIIGCTDKPLDGKN